MGYVKTWIYKRTHKGDPDKSGIFGINDCMKTKRGDDYDSVIGVGGKKPWKRDKDISLKINWIGLGPTRKNKGRKRGPIVTFKHFCLYEEKGPHLKTVAPKLFKYMFVDSHVLQVKSPSLPENLRKEITKILKKAEKCPKSTKSRGLSSRKESRGKCK